MKKWMIEALICPECLIKDRKLEIPLSPEIHSETDADILEGSLSCPDCGRKYDISEGIAVVVPEATLPITRETTGYGSFSMLSSYLWSHFSEFFNGPDATDAYKKWASAFGSTNGKNRETAWAPDIGCSVGRLTFELTKTHARAIGIDTSTSFIRAAREVAARQHLEFDMILEGQIMKKQSSSLDPDFRYHHAEFIVADAMALPFRSGRFATAGTVNILEKVPDPSVHLAEANRVMDKENADFLFSDPFTWDEAVNSPDLWLGGRNEGPFQGYGMDNVTRLLREETGIFAPGFDILSSGEVEWKIRKTRHLREHITSQFIIARRQSR